MKGKLSVRFNMPNIQRLRSRIENPTKEFSSQIREELASVVCQVLNENQLSIKANMIAFIDSLELTFKNEAHKAQVYSIVNSIFDSYFAPSAEALAELTGEECDPSESDEPAKEGASEDADSGLEDFD